MKHEIDDEVVADFSIDDDDPVSVFIYFTIHINSQFFCYDNYLF